MSFPLPIFTFPSSACPPTFHTHTTSTPHLDFSHRSQPLKQLGDVEPSWNGCFVPFTESYSRRASTPLFVDSSLFDQVQSEEDPVYSQQLVLDLPRRRKKLGCNYLKVTLPSPVIQRALCSVLRASVSYLEKTQTPFQSLSCLSNNTTRPLFKSEVYSIGSLTH